MKEELKPMLGFFGGIFGFMAILFLVVFLLTRDKRTEEEKAFAHTPHIIREFDGCKTYKFEDDGAQHYVTRCPNSTVTHEKDWYERQGKSSVLRQETNVTVGQ